MPDRQLTRTTALLFGALLVLVGCGELTPPEAYAPSTSTTLADGVEQQIDSQVEEAPGRVPRVDEFVPPPPPDYVPTLLVSGSNFVLGAREIELDESGAIGSASGPLTGELAGLSTDRVVDDLGGGLVVQQSDGAIVYRPALVEPEVLIEDGARLLDVGYWNGSPRAFVDVGNGQVDRIQLVTEPGAGTATPGPLPVGG